MAKNQLHQLLAVENDRKQKANLIMSETENTFVKKQEHFDGLVKTYIPKNDEDSDLIPDEIKAIVTTVADKVNYTKDAVVTAINAQLSKEETNASGEARADLVFGDKTFSLSATSLLALEQNLLKIREVYKAIPTLDPAKTWNNDSTEGNGFFKTDPEVKYRTKKITRPLVKVAATDKHPAQVELVSEDIQVGHYETIYKSGKLTPAQKSNLLSRIDDLIDSVKRTRAVANQAEVKNIEIGKEIFDFINKDII